jgi:thiol-disulfide isomerase/thioredoxin
MWINKLSYGSFTGKIDKVEITDFRFQNTEGDTLSLNDYRGKIVVVDCWYTHCGVCYKKFPEVQAFYDKFKGNPEIVFFALHSRTKNKGEKETPEKGYEILKDEGYTFPCFSIDIDEPKLKELGVDRYPIVLIFDKENNMIFRGNIRNVEKFINKILCL